MQLREQARSEPAASSRRGPTPRLVVFGLHGQRYALAAEDVIEVQRMVQLVALPGAPRIVEGVFDLRGRLVPVLDVRDRFGLAPKPVDPADHLVIARAGARTVALRVDAVLGLTEVPQDRIDRAASRFPGVIHVEGVAHDDEGLIVLHDLATFLALEEEDRLDAALADSAGP
ncbi:MAG: chemotaxis protein CheW [Actinobacteria bacterium]|nr:chemotaxis protein CheW [Actinomycetota bacterium]